MSEVNQEMKIGDPDGGGVYVGLSETTGLPLHAALADEPEYLTFDEAFEAAAKMRNQPGRENAHVPTPEELDTNLFKNKNVGWLRGTFNTSGSVPASCYHSSMSGGENKNLVLVQWFDTGFQSPFHRVDALPVRLVW